MDLNPNLLLVALAFVAIAAAVVIVPMRLRRRTSGTQPPSTGRGLRYALLLVLAAPLLALAGYWLFAPPAEDPLLAGEHDPERLVGALEAKLREQPRDIDGWLVLGKSYALMGRWVDARDAYAKASEIAPERAAAWSGRAEALGVLANRVLAGEPMALVRKALDLDPMDEKALELAGINAFQERNYAQAAYYWRQLLKKLPPDVPYTEDIRAAAQQARRLAEEAALEPGQSPPAPSPQAAAEGQRILGTVELAPQLRERAAEDDPVYLFVRPMEGSGAPVAALKARAGQLPLVFQIDDSLAANAENRLSLHKRVSISARISRSGDAAPTPGDLEGARLDVAVGSENVRVVIDQVRP